MKKILFAALSAAALLFTGCDLLNSVAGDSLGIIGFWEIIPAETTFPDPPKGVTFFSQEGKMCEYNVENKTINSNADYTYDVESKVLVLTFSADEIFNVAVTELSATRLKGDISLGGETYTIAFSRRTDISVSDIVTDPQDPSGGDFDTEAMVVNKFWLIDTEKTTATEWPQQTLLFAPDGNVYGLDMSSSEANEQGIYVAVSAYPYHFSEDVLSLTINGGELRLLINEAGDNVLVGEHITGDTTSEIYAFNRVDCSGVKAVTWNDVIVWKRAE